MIATLSLVVVIAALRDEGPSYRDIEKIQLACHVLGCAVTEVHQEVACLLGNPGAAGVGGDVSD